jgi:hypothetical protein
MSPEPPANFNIERGIPQHNPTQDTLNRVVRPLRPTPARLERSKLDSASPA